MSMVPGTLACVVQHLKDSMRNENPAFGKELRIYGKEHDLWRAVYSHASVKPDVVGQMALFSYVAVASPERAIEGSMEVFVNRMINSMSTHHGRYLGKETMTWAACAGVFMDAGLTLCRRCVNHGKDTSELAMSVFRELDNSNTRCTVVVKGSVEVCPDLNSATALQCKKRACRLLHNGVKECSCIEIHL